MKKKQEEGKNMSERGQIVLGAFSAFFKAMMDGYVGGTSRKSVKTKTPDGYTNIVFVDGDYRVEDRYHTIVIPEKKDHSEGKTSIFHQNVLVWEMFYEGHYPDEVIPFLKKVLAETYKREKFVGGRGPVHFSDDQHAYTNIVERVDFTDFSGVEAIQPVPGGFTIGYHKYHGGLV